MHAIRVLTLTDEEGNTYRVSLPENARVEGQGDATIVRINPGDEFNDLSDPDGLIEMTPAAILQFARDGIDGFALVPAEQRADTTSAS